MTPVFQSKLYQPDGIHNGNCFAACLGSLMNLPLWMVPPFEDMFAREVWRVRSNDWLRSISGEVLHRTDGHAVKLMPEFYIANGRSTRGVHHSVIYSAGGLVHDPHPSGAGIHQVEWTYHLVRDGCAKGANSDINVRIG